MPFKSKAQRRKFAELLVQGKITPEAYERWNKETGGAELPEYAHGKSKSKGSEPKGSRSKRSKPKSSVSIPKRGRARARGAGKRTVTRRLR